MNDLELFVKALSYEAHNEQEAMDYFPYLFHLTENNALWQLQVLAKMYWPGGEYANEVYNAALHLIEVLPEDVMRMPKVIEITRTFGVN